MRENTRDANFDVNKECDFLLKKDVMIVNRNISLPQEEWHMTISGGIPYKQMACLSFSLCIAQALCLQLSSVCWLLQTRSHHQILGEPLYCPLRLSIQCRNSGGNIQHSFVFHQSFLQEPQNPHHHLLYQQGSCLFLNNIGKWNSILNIPMDILKSCVRISYIEHFNVHDMLNFPQGRGSVGVLK